MVIMQTLCRSKLLMQACWAHRPVDCVTMNSCKLPYVATAAPQMRKHHMHCCCCLTWPSACLSCRMPPVTSRLLQTSRTNRAAQTPPQTHPTATRTQLQQHQADTALPTMTRHMPHPSSSSSSLVSLVGMLRRLQHQCATATSQPP
jgi:hypothetical protein